MATWRCSCDTIEFPVRDHGVAAEHCEPFDGKDEGLAANSSLSAENQSMSLSEDRFGQEGYPPVLKNLEFLKLMTAAAEEGRISDMKELFKNFPGTVTKHTPSRETALHAAVRHGQFQVVMLLVQWLQGTPYYKDVINRKDYYGDTVLHLATYRKQLQTLKLLLGDNPGISGMVDVNARNCDGFTALDIVDGLPDGGELGMEIEKVLRKAGARKGRDLDAQKNGKNNREFVIEVGKQWHRPSPSRAMRTRSLTSMHHAALITATLLAILAFYALLRAPGGLVTCRRAVRPSSDLPLSITGDASSLIGTFQSEKEDKGIKKIFVWFNSMAFFASMAFITILMHELPLKPWLLASVFSTTGAYMCIIMAVSPHQVVSVLYIGSSVLLVAFLNCLAQNETVLHYLECMCLRYSPRNLETMGCKSYVSL